MLPFPAWGTPATLSQYKCKTSWALNSPLVICCVVGSPVAAGPFSLNACKFPFLLSCKAKCLRKVLATISCCLFHTNGMLIAGFCYFTSEHLLSKRCFSNIRWGGVPLQQSLEDKCKSFICTVLALKIIKHLLMLTSLSSACSTLLPLVTCHFCR